MKNLELKAHLTPEQLSLFDDSLKSCTIKQKDTYYKTNNGDRLKIREEINMDTNMNNTYAIRYNRPDIKGEKFSTYDFHQFENDENYVTFLKVFNPVLQLETIVEKTRGLYLYKNARIHVDDVTELDGLFMEIEVVIKTEEEDMNSHAIMTELIHMLQIKPEDHIDIGYREMLLQKNSTLQEKTLEYYANTDKIFWVVNKDINDYIKANDIVPCIYVEKTTDSYNILQFDPSITDDNFKYCAWRKFLGDIYDIYTDVLLIYTNPITKSLKLCTLAGLHVNFDELNKNGKFISKEHLAKFSLIK